MPLRRNRIAPCRQSANNINWLEKNKNSQFQGEDAVIANRYFKFLSPLLTF